MTLEWRPELSVGVSSLDAQHQEWLRRIGVVLQAAGPPTQNNQLAQAFADLIDYTSFHFQQEEEQFRITGYTEAFSHQDVHRFMKKRLLELRDQFVHTTFDAQQLEKFVILLEDWVVLHIQGIDKKYGPHLQRAGIQ